MSVTANPTQSRSRPKSGGMDQTITLTAQTGLELLEDTGVGPVRQIVLKATNLAVALTDDGATGHGSLELFTFPAGVISIMGSTLDLDTVLSAGTTASTSLGSAVTNADSDLSDSGEADICTASTASATVANVFRAASNDTRLDGTTTAKKCYLNCVTTGDPGASATNTYTGLIYVTWRNDGDY
jgi:hypothetical protein